jgi:hypothetical protein
MGRIEMEFYNERLLTKGLPEIIAAFTPTDIYDDTKVITYSHKKRRGLKGESTDNDSTRNYKVELWPSTICATPGQCNYRMPVGFEGTYSFQLWRDQLFVALHEIGHLVTREQANKTTREEYDLRGDSYYYIEHLADEFAFRSMVRILEVDSRMGQPLGALTGYSGIKAYERRSGSFNEIDKGRIAEWRALKCGAQITLSDVVKQLWNEFLKYHKDFEYLAAYPLISRIIHSQAKHWNIGRYFTNRNAKKFLMFNIGEAQQITDICVPICREVRVKANLKSLYKRLGCLSDTEKDKDTLAWEKTTFESISKRTQLPFMHEFWAGIEMNGWDFKDIDINTNNPDADIEPDDIPF